MQLLIQYVQPHTVQTQRHAAAQCVEVSWTSAFLLPRALTDVLFLLFVPSALRGVHVTFRQGDGSKTLVQVGCRSGQSLVLRHMGMKGHSTVSLMWHRLDAVQTKNGMPKNATKDVSLQTSMTALGCCIDATTGTAEPVAQQASGKSQKRE